jgi:hypothetical protein
LLINALVLLINTGLAVWLGTSGHTLGALIFVVGSVLGVGHLVRDVRRVRADRQDAEEIERWVDSRG